MKLLPSRSARAPRVPFAPFAPFAPTVLPSAAVEPRRTRSLARTLAAAWERRAWTATALLATLLLYRLIARGNLVNVTSLFYLVPAVTAVMDFLIFGNRLAALSLLGMALIVIGLLFVFRQPSPA